MPAQGQFAVMLTAVPAAGGFLAKLLGGGGAQAKIVKAIQSLTALDTRRAKALTERLPSEVARFATEQEARVAAQTLEDAGGTCQIRPL